MRYSTLLLLALFLTGILRAQVNIVGLNLKAYTPTSSFNDNIKSTPVGVSVSYLRTIQNSRLSFGLEAGFAEYSREDVVTEFQGREIEIQAVDGFFNVHGVIRYDLLDFGWTTFYGEGKIGATTFFTEYSLGHCPVAEEMEYEGELTTHGSAFNLGLGAGIMINPTIFFDYDRESDFWIDFSVSTFSGSISNYQVVKNDEQSDKMSSERKSSLTNYLDYKIGVIFKL
ncbi:MAG: hypothetical protein RJQ00_06665 [Vicingaceae bacterium]